MPRFYNLLWECPYHKTTEQLAVQGECGRIAFKDKEMARDYLGKFCASHGWQDCSMAKELNEYYERKDNERQMQRKNEKGQVGGSTKQTRSNKEEL